MIDITDLTQVMTPQMVAAVNEDAIKHVLNNIVAGAHAEWIRLAGARLSRTRRDYMGGIQVRWVDDSTAVLSLVGQLPNLVEHGQERTDMHDTLLGPNVPTVPPGKRGKHPRKGGGYYRAIPFRHQTPGGSGATGMPMGRPYGGHAAVADARKLGQQVYEKARKLGGTTSQPGGPTAWGERLAVDLPKLKPHHATNIYSGMVRTQKTYVAATQSGYMTWRMISTGSRGWIRPDTRPGAQLTARVVDYIHKNAPAAFEAYVQGLG